MAAPLASAGERWRSGGVRFGRGVLLSMLALGIVGSGCTHAPWHPFRGWRTWRRGSVVLYTDTLYEQQQALEWLVGSTEILQATFFRHVNVTPGALLDLPSADGRRILGHY